VPCELFVLNGSFNHRRISRRSTRTRRRRTAVCVVSIRCDWRKLLVG